MNFPLLKTPRLVLDEITADDTAAVFALFADPRVVHYYDLEPFTETSQAERLIALFSSRFESSAGIRWAIRLADDNELIGSCGFNSWSAKMHNANIGYDLKPTYWNRGIATEAVAGAIGAAFAGRLPCGPLHRIQADTLPGNTASERLLLKLGFKFEGMHRESICLNGTFHDANCFGLLKPEFMAG